MRSPPQSSSVAAAMILLAMFFATRASAFDRTSPAHSIVIGGVNVPEEPVLQITDLAQPENHKLRVFHIKSDSDNFTDSGVVAYIQSTQPTASEPNPCMPQLQVQLEDIDPQLTVHWRFEVRYVRPSGRDLPQDQVQIPSNGTVSLPAKAAWNLFESYKNQPFFGGNATIFFTVCKGNECSPEHAYRFQIGGRNPDEKTARQYIDSQVPKVANDHHQPPMWYAYAIAKHETKYEAGKGEAPYYAQFLPLGYKPKRNKKPPLHPDFGAPNWNDDGEYRTGPKAHQKKPGGYGVFQVTGFNNQEDADVPREVIWNWQKNVDAGLEELARKQQQALSYVATVKRLAGLPIPSLRISVKSGDFVFEEQGKKNFADLVTMKLYNGVGCRSKPDPDPEPAPQHFFYTRKIPTGKNFLYYSTQNHKYELSRYNTYDPAFVYVDRVCLEIEE